MVQVLSGGKRVAPADLPNSLHDTKRRCGQPSGISAGDDKPDITTSLAPTQESKKPDPITSNPEVKDEEVKDEDLGRFQWTKPTEEQNKLADAYPDQEKLVESLSKCFQDSFREDKKVDISLLRDELNKKREWIASYQASNPGKPESEEKKDDQKDDQKEKKDDQKEKKDDQKEKKDDPKEKKDDPKEKTEFEMTRVDFIGSAANAVFDYTKEAEEEMVRRWKVMLRAQAAMKQGME